MTTEITEHQIQNIIKNDFPTYDKLMFMNIRYSEYTELLYDLRRELKGVALMEKEANLKLCVSYFWSSEYRMHSLVGAFRSELKKLPNSRVSALLDELEKEIPEFKYDPTREPLP
jgi:hypothetical protein